MDVLNGTNPYNTDAYDEIFQTAPQQSYNLSVQGGNEKIKYAVSGEYTSQEGIIVTNKFQRFSARANLDAKLSDRVSMKFNMNSTYSNGRNILASGGAAESEGILGAATTWLNGIHYIMRTDLTLVVLDKTLPIMCGTLWHRLMR